MPSRGLSCRVLCVAASLYWEVTEMWVLLALRYDYFFLGLSVHTVSTLVLTCLYRKYVFRTYLGRSIEEGQAT